MFLLRPRILSAKAYLRQFTTTNISTILERVQTLASSNHLEEAITLFYTLNPPPHSPQTYATLFHGCARAKQLHLGQALHRHMLSYRAAPPLDLHVANHLINMYAKCRHLNLAHDLFDQMSLRNLVSWTSLISGYAQTDNTDKCFGLFSDMLTCFRPNDFAYTSVLSICDYLRGRQVHAHVFKTGFHACVYVGNALLSMYTRTAQMVFCSSRNVDGSHDAWRVFDGMEFKNLVTWNSIIEWFRMRGEGDKAVNFFVVMHSDGLGSDHATLLSVLSALCGYAENDQFHGLQIGVQLHCICVKCGFVTDAGVVTALVKVYSNLGGKVDDCYKLFVETSDICRDVVLWTGIMTALVETEPEKVLFLFVQLRREGVNPDCYAFSVVLKACSGLFTDKHALAVHCQVIKFGFRDIAVIENVLLHAYSRCGSLDSAKQVFDEMVLRDIVSWNSLLKAYAFHGKGEDALELFKHMDVEPDSTTFVALLSACSHSGMVAEGAKIFDGMFEKYGIIPQLDHYACMVDILGRAGKIYEALKTIREMPVKPDYVMWSSLLGACRKHGETSVANLALSKMKELNPERSLGYVMMSNLHCVDGSFHEAGAIRKEMKGFGVIKEPGLSWTEFGQRADGFASGG